MEFANAYMIDIASFLRFSRKGFGTLFVYTLLKNKDIAISGRVAVKKGLNYFTTVTVPLRLKSVPYIPVASTV